MTCGDCARHVCVVVLMDPDITCLVYAVIVDGTKDRVRGKKGGGRSSFFFLMVTRLISVEVQML